MTACDRTPLKLSKKVKVISKSRLLDKNIINYESLYSVFVQALCNRTTCCTDGGTFDGMAFLFLICTTPTPKKTTKKKTIKKHLIFRINS